MNEWKWIFSGYFVLTKSRSYLIVSFSFLPIQALATDGAISGADASLTETELGRLFQPLRGQVNDSLKRQEDLLSNIQRTNTQFSEQVCLVEEWNLFNLSLFTLYRQFWSRFVYLLLLHPLFLLPSLFVSLFLLPSLFASLFLLYSLLPLIRNLPAETNERLFSRTFPLPTMPSWNWRGIWRREPSSTMIWRRFSSSSNPKSV